MGEQTLYLKMKGWCGDSASSQAWTPCRTGLGKGLLTAARGLGKPGFSTLYSPLPETRVWPEIDPSQPVLGCFLIQVQVGWPSTYCVQSSITRKMGHLWGLPWACIAQLSAQPSEDG